MCVILALWDFIHYRRRKGNYGENQPSIFGLGFRGYPPKRTRGWVLPGDILFTQRLNAWFSWGMMYFSSSPLDHTAILTGDDGAIHVTFDGVSEDPLRAVTWGTRSIIVRPINPRGMGNVETANPTWHWSRLWGKSSAKVQLTAVAADIVLGFYPERFKWKFILDLVLTGILADAFLFIFGGPVLFSFFTLLCFSVAVFNQGRWKVLSMFRRPPPKPASHPDLLLRAIYEDGCLIFTAMGPIIQGPFGVLPLKAAQAIAEQANDNGDENNYFRVFLERLNALEIECENFGPASA